MSPLVNKVPLCKACIYFLVPWPRKRRNIVGSLQSSHVFTICSVSFMQDEYPISTLSVFFYILALCSVTSQYFDVMSSMSGFYVIHEWIFPVLCLSSCPIPSQCPLPLWHSDGASCGLVQDRWPRVVQLLQVLHRYCSVKWSCMGHHSLSFSASCGYSLWRCVISIDTTGHSTALPFSSWVDSCQRKGFSLWRRWATAWVWDSPCWPSC